MQSVPEPIRTEEVIGFLPRVISPDRFMSPVKSSVADVIISSITRRHSVTSLWIVAILTLLLEAGLSDVVWSGALWVFSESRWACIGKSAQDG